MTDQFSPAQRTALEWVDANAKRLSADHLTLWNLAEPSWREYRSAAFFVEALRQEDFDVEEGSGGMPTAPRPERIRAGSASEATFAFRRRNAP